MISDVLFDLDDTLCDFRGARERAIAAALAILPARDVAQAEACFRRVEPTLFTAFAAGGITREAYRRLRFERVLEEIGYGGPSGSGEIVIEMNRAFLREINAGAALLPGASACLHELRARGLRCHLLTNGPGDSQRARVAALGLEGAFAAVLVAEELGAFKPDPAIFRRALSEIGVPAHAAAMVGNDLEADVRAARRAGLHAIHYAPGGSPYRPCVARLEDVPRAIETCATLA